MRERALNTSVIIADDHPIVLGGLMALIGSRGMFSVLATAEDGDKALALVLEQLPDLAVVDLNMPGRSGLEVLRAARDAGAATKVVLLAASASDAQIYDALEAGAAGLVFKGEATEMLLTCLDVVAAGGSWFPLERSGPATARETVRRAKWHDLSRNLTLRELEIVRLVASGQSNKAIAFQLELSVGTAKVHLNNIFRKLHVSSRSQLCELVGEQAQPERAPEAHVHPH